MKPALLRGLPHLFRLIERPGLVLPRRFFTPASEYKSISPGLRIDTVFPAVSDIPRVVESMRHPMSRGRSISIGPQSAADAYETLAYRERRRRESIGSNGSVRSRRSLQNLKEDGKEDDDKTGRVERATGRGALREWDDVVDQGDVLVSPVDDSEMEGFLERENQLDQKEVFSQLVKPRVRYDIEVVTKLVVYTGRSLSAFWRINYSTLTILGQELHGYRWR